MLKERKTIVSTTGEPDATKINALSDTYKIDLVNALNWYSYHKDAKDARKYFIDWAKKSRKDLVDAIAAADNCPTTFGWIARLLTHGAVLSEASKSLFLEYLDNLKIKAEEPVFHEVKTTWRPTVQDSIKEKTGILLGELEGVVDDILFGSNVAPGMKGWLHTREVAAIYLPAIDTWAKRKMGEYVTVFKGKDPFIKEAYSNIIKKNIVTLLAFLKDCVEESQSYGQHKKANRKPRAKKTIAPAQQVKALKFKTSDDELKLKSISPTEIIGAQQLWVFNTKYRKLGVYKTDSAMGLQVKGTSIQNYLPEESAQKTLRKPAVTIKECLSAGKVALRKVLDNINAKAAPMSGRINEDTILLRVVK